MNMKKTFQLGYQLLHIRHLCLCQRPLQERLGHKRLSLSRALCDGASEGYDVIVVGGGHAGTEAACAAARMGMNTVMVTHKLETIGEMSCNPSFGGIGKGHLMREVDALDGVCGRICDKSGIQYRVLNKRKGPAVWGPRAQIDRSLYKRHMQEEVMKTDNLTVVACPVEDLLLAESSQPQHHLTKQTCHGVILGNGDKLYGKTVILTTGTFLRANINIGLEVWPAGRLGDEPAIGLAKSLENAGFTLGRLKTGTPPRLDGKTIDYSKLVCLPGDNPPMPFSFINDAVWIKGEDQVLCHLTHTTDQVANIINNNMHLNRHVKEETQGPSLDTGEIQPHNLEHFNLIFQRYCPSVESKVIRFRKNRHQIWLEPEGLETDVVYPQGLSCTLPPDLQQQLVNCMPGLERTQVVKPGYGVEYDFIDPRQIKVSLETYRIQNLFFAGQINGTTGYEEAAAQGILAGINASLKVRQQPPFTIDRTEGYIGVLVDDLTTQGTNEPYRMFTSRAEFRLHLRPDNADLRLTLKGHQVGCVSTHRYQRAAQMKGELAGAIQHLGDFTKTQAQWRWYLNRPVVAKQRTQSKSALQLLAGPHYPVELLVEAFPEDFSYLLDNPSLAARVKIEAMYRSALEEQEEEINEIRRDEGLVLPDDLDYNSLESLSLEAKDKLGQARPQTIAAASRIQGITPAAITVLLKHVKRRGSSAKQNITKNDP